ncbi:MAG: acylneuraminate cytidylyltransferase family protein [Acidobacteria bacterium]|nr:acylneuraminate cytidylyltransferase family protein [Acidobacteriota bacterium]
MKILGIIPARGGSKALPGKNIRPFAGKPLIQYACEAADASGVVDRLVLSTDSETIATLAARLGLDVPCLRPAEFARDESPMIDAALHMVAHLAQDGYHADAVMILQPTSPLRTADHLRRAVGLLQENDSVCSVVAVSKEANPFSMMKVRTDGFLDFIVPEAAAITRRQDLPTAYRRDGTVFLTRTSVLVNEKTFYGQRCVPMPLESWEASNIDTLEDWTRAEALLNR